MQNISITRYRDNEAISTRVHHDGEGNEVSREDFKAHAGRIEGTRDDGTAWVMHLDAQGNPQTYWDRLDANGMVSGHMIDLER